MTTSYDITHYKRHYTYTHILNRNYAKNFRKTVYRRRLFEELTQ